MSDLVSRQAAIDAVQDRIGKGETNIGDTFIECFEMILNSLPSAQPDPQWIPCSNAPDTDRNVFIARGEQNNMTACIGHYDHDRKQWYEDRNWYAMCLYDVLYWCEIPPLPEPYKGGS